MKALLGMIAEEFELLVPQFEKILFENASKKPRKRPVGAGRKGRLKKVRFTSS